MDVGPLSADPWPDDYQAGRRSGVIAAYGVPGDGWMSPSQWHARIRSELGGQWAVGYDHEFVPGFGHVTRPKGWAPGWDALDAESKRTVAAAAAGVVRMGTGEPCRVTLLARIWDRQGRMDRQVDRHVVRPLQEAIARDQIARERFAAGLGAQRTSFTPIWTETETIPAAGLPGWVHWACWAAGRAWHWAWWSAVWIAVTACGFLAVRRPAR